MSFFNKIEGAVILRSRGKYMPCALYERDRLLYAKHGRTFVKLLKDERTSVDKLFWAGLDIVGGVTVAFEPVTSALILSYPLLTQVAK